MLGELLGAGVSLLGGLMGSSAEKDAAKEQAAVDRENLALQKEFFYAQLAEAQRQEKEAKLGQHDAYGNYYHYVEGKGWVIDLTPEQKIMQALQQGEEKTQLAQDVPAARQKMFETLATQRDEGSYADALRQQMQRSRMQDPRDLQNQQNLVTAQSLTETMDPSVEAATRNAIRMGDNSGASDIASRMGADQAAELRKAFLEGGAGGGAREQAQSQYDTEQSNLANLYNMFQTRATQAPGVTYNPSDLESSANSQLNKASSSGAQSSQNLLNAFQQTTPQNPSNPEPQYGMANTFASLGNTLGSINFDNIFGTSSGSNSSYNTYPSAPSSSGTYKGSTGLW